METLKNPRSKRDDPVITWEQEAFLNIYKDIPASEIPNTGVADSKNVLLFGNHAKVRPGSEQHTATAIPKLVDSVTGIDYALTGMSKTGAVVTTGNSKLEAGHVGQFITYADGSADLIISFSDADNVTVDNSTARASTTGSLRGRVNGLDYHKKSGYIFLHIGTLLYYADSTFTPWTKVEFWKGQALGNTKSEFDFFKDSGYIGNASGLFEIDISDTTNVRVMQINLASPPNTIGPMTDELNSVNVTPSYPPTAIESNVNRFGRRYLFTMVKLDGNGDADRGDGTRIVKESGTNTFPASNDYKDFKESWRVHGFFKSDTFGLRVYSTLKLDVVSPGHELSDFTSQGVGAIRLVIESKIRDVVFDFKQANTWDDIAAIMQIAIRAVYSEYPYIQVVFDIAGYILIVSGDPTIDVTSMTSPSVVSFFDFTQVGYFTKAEQVAELVPSWTAIGTEASPALQAPSGQYGYTHFGIWSTKTLGPSSRDAEGNSLVNTENFIWQLDVPLIKPIHALVVSGSLIYSQELIYAHDVGSWYYHDDGTANQITALVAASNGASNKAFVYDSGTTVKTNDKSTGSNTTQTSLKLIDSAATFQTDSVAAGDLVVNSTTLLFALVVTIDSEIQLTLDTNIFLTTGDFYNVGGGALSIGSQEPMRGTKSGTTLTKTQPASGTFDFVAADIGKVLFFADGSIEHVKSITNVTTLETVETSTKSTSTAFAFEPSGRNYNDGITDILLGDRQAQFSVLNRFNSALPNGDLISVIPGFLAVASKNGSRVSYSQYATPYQYLAGHHSADFQKDEIKDKIKFLAEMPDRLIVWCANSTWRFQTNIVNNVVDPRAFESIAVLSGLSHIDLRIGVPDKGCIIEKGHGEKIVITQEPGIRVFNGDRYGPNLLYDERGRGHIVGEVQSMRAEFTATYEQNLYGLIFWANVSTYDPGVSSFVKSDKCFRLAFEPHQGFGFCELDQADWIFPELGGKALQITNAKDDVLTIAIADNDGRPYVISTRKTSTATAQSKRFVDRYGDAATEIIWSMKLLEHKAPKESYKLRFIEDYWYFRPEDEANQGGSGYDANGFRDGQLITLKAFLDGSTTKASEISTIDPKSDLVHPYVVEARRITLEISGTTSEMVITSTEAKYDVLRWRQPPGSPKETTYQNRFGAVLFWLSRAGEPTINRATGLGPDTQVGDFTLDPDTASSGDAGPDGYSNSALRFDDNTGNLQYDDITGPDTRDIFFGCYIDNNITTDVVIYREKVSASTKKWEIRLSGVSANGSSENKVIASYAGVDKLTVNIDDDTWYAFRIRIKAGSPRATYTKSDLTTVETTGTTVAGTSSHTGTIQLDAGQAQGNVKFFDTRLYNDIGTGLSSADDQDLFEYYARDVFTYSGKSLLPLPNLYISS